MNQETKNRSWRSRIAGITEHPVVASVVSTGILALIGVFVQARYFGQLDDLVSLPLWVVLLLSLIIVWFLTLESIRFFRRRRETRPRRIQFDWGGLRWEVDRSMLTKPEEEIGRIPSGERTKKVRGPFCSNAKCQRRIECIEDLLLDSSRRCPHCEHSHDLTEEMISELEYGPPGEGRPEFDLTKVLVVKELQAAVRRGSIKV